MLHNLESLKQTDWFLRFLASFCPPEALARLSQCSKLFNTIFSNDKLYEDLCIAYGFKQISMTKTRGKKAWKQVFLSSLCLECKSYLKIIIFDICGGQHTRAYGCEMPSSSFIPLCYQCYKTVHEIPINQRFKSNLLPISKSKLPTFRFIGLLSNVPEQSKKKKKRKLNSSSRNGSSASSSNTSASSSSSSSNSADPMLRGALENNHLVRALK